MLLGREREREKERENESFSSNLKARGRETKRIGQKKRERETKKRYMFSMTMIRDARLPMPKMTPHALSLAVLPRVATKTSST